MNFYFKLMTWLYLLAGIAAAGMTIYFQVNGMHEEAIYTLVCVFVCGIMLGLRTWQRKRMEKLEAYLREKEAQEKKKGQKKKK